MAILHEASPLVEQMSIDEAYVDLTGQVSAWEEAVDVARRLQARVRDEIGLSASLGVAANKVVPKWPPGATSRWPDGRATRAGSGLPGTAAGADAAGVGPVTAQKLAELGVATIGDLAGVQRPSCGRASAGPVPIWPFGHAASTISPLSRARSALN